MSEYRSIERGFLIHDELFPRAVRVWYTRLLYCMDRAKTASASGFSKRVPNYCIKENSFFKKKYISFHESGGKNANICLTLERELTEN